MRDSDAVKVTPRHALLTAVGLAALSALVSHVYVRTPAATLTLNPVGTFASLLVSVAIGFALYAGLVARGVPGAGGKAALGAVAAHLVLGVAFLFSLLLVPEDGPAARFIGYGVSPGGWIAAVLLWPFAAPWLLACAGGIAPCP